jgi:hypothetical protein
MRLITKHETDFLGIRSVRDVLRLSFTPRYVYRLRSLTDIPEVYVGSFKSRCGGHTDRVTAYILHIGKASKLD